jgi:hypothetical protein
MAGRPSWGAFAVWTVIGVVCGFGLVVFPSVVFLLLVGALVVAIVRPAWFRSGVGAFAGVGLVSLYIAFVQRQGPGTVCWQRGTEAGCDEYLDPKPWLLVGLAMVVVAVVVHVRQVRRDRLLQEGSRDSVSP